MTDLATAVQQAVYDALSAGVTMAPVVSHVAEDATYPFVLIGDDVITEIGPKGSRLERHEVSISAVIQATSKLPLRQIQEQARAALHEQAITASGAVLSNPVLLSTNDTLLDDGTTYLGGQSFLIFAQPAS